MLLEGKKAIITGGTRGIGYAIACRFIEEGAAVTVFGSRQETADAAVECEYPDFDGCGIGPSNCPEYISCEDYHEQEKQEEFYE